MAQHRGHATAWGGTAVTGTALRALVCSLLALTLEAANIKVGMPHPKDQKLPTAFYDNWYEVLDLDKETPGPEYPQKPVKGKFDPPKIFVGTSAYRDMACPGTLFHAFKMAKHPERLYFGVVDQVAYGDEDCVDGYCRMWHKEINDTSVCPYFQHIKLTRLPSFDAKGPTKARHFQGDLIDGQDFCMQVDSHTMFAQDWDVKMVEMWGMTNNENAVLSTYLPGAENYGVENMAGHNEVPHICNVQWSAGKILRNAIASAAANLPRPKLNTLWAAGLSFSKCHAELATPYDDSLPQTFDGEEISKAARLFTHGYDLYTPHRNYIWHIYKRMRRGEWYADGSKSGNKRSFEVPDPEEPNGQDRQNREKEGSLHRLQTLFRLPGASGEDLGPFTFGTKRTLNQFLDFIGVNYTLDTITKAHGCGNLQWVPWVKPPPPPGTLPAGGQQSAQLATVDSRFEIERTLGADLSAELPGELADDEPQPEHEAHELHRQIITLHRLGTTVATCVVAVVLLVLLVCVRQGKKAGARSVQAARRHREAARGAV